MYFKAYCSIIMIFLIFICSNMISVEAKTVAHLDKVRYEDKIKNTQPNEQKSGSGTISVGVEEVASSDMDKNKSNVEENSDTSSAKVDTQGTPNSIIDNKEEKGPNVSNDKYGTDFNLGIEKLPMPMTYAQAVLYQKQHQKEIYISDYRTKDKFGNKNTQRVFDLMGKYGFSNSGGSLSGVADITELRLSICYGFSNENIRPYVVLYWGGNFDGAPDKGFAPTMFVLVFEDGYSKNLNLEGYSYTRRWFEGIFVNTWSHYYSGTIKLDDFALFDMVQHGNVAGAYLATAYGGMRHLFYSGDKNIEHKKRMTKGLQHACVMMNINADTITAERKNIEFSAEVLKRETMKAEIKNEIIDEYEREKIRQEVKKELLEDGIIK